MIADSVRFLKRPRTDGLLRRRALLRRLRVRRVYALHCLKTAAGAGADGVVLCDTNGGTLTSRLTEIVRAVRRRSPVPARHPHPQRRRRRGREHPRGGGGGRDAGAGCVNGYGEQLRQRQHVQHHRQPQAQAGHGRRQRRAAPAPDRGLPLHQRDREHAAVPAAAYVGASAFAHKAGLHADAVVKEELGLPARRPGRRRQRTPHPDLGAGRPPQRARQDGRTGHRHRSQRRRSAGARRPRQGNGKSRAISTKAPRRRSSCWSAAAFPATRRPSSSTTS